MNEQKYNILWIQDILGNELPELLTRLSCNFIGPVHLKSVWAVYGL